MHRGLRSCNHALAARFFLVCASQCCSHVTHASFAHKNDASVCACFSRALEIMHVCINTRAAICKYTERGHMRVFVRNLSSPAVKTIRPRSFYLSRLRLTLNATANQARIERGRYSHGSHAGAVSPVAGISSCRLRETRILAVYGLTQRSKSNHKNFAKNNLIALLSDMNVSISLDILYYFKIKLPRAK